MADNTYCYRGTNVLKNKLNIKSQQALSEAETDIVFARLLYLQRNPIKGKYDFDHLKAIHKYMFQDIYEWAGKVRTVEIGKGNLFCTTACIDEYAKSVFDKFFKQCYATKDNNKEFIRALADNYGDINALHPFREGNGRTQREFARLVCRVCGYEFCLKGVSHEQMLEASILSFNKCDNSKLIENFSAAIRPLNDYIF